MTDRRILLSLKEEAEGHGVLFIEDGRDREAVALISRTAMKAFGENQIEQMADVIGPAVTKKLVGGTFPPIARLEAEPSEYEEEQHAASEVLRFINWLYDSYTVYDGESLVDDPTELANGYAISGDGYDNLLKTSRLSGAMAFLNWVTSDKSGFNISTDVELTLEKAIRHFSDEMGVELSK